MVSPTTMSLPSAPAATLFRDERSCLQPSPPDGVPGGVRGAGPRNGDAQPTRHAMAGLCGSTPRAALTFINCPAKRSERLSDRRRQPAAAHGPASRQGSRRLAFRFSSRATCWRCVLISACSGAFSAREKHDPARMSAAGASATSRDRYGMIAFGQEAEARRRLSVRIHEFTD